MGSAIYNLQREILAGNQSITQLIRQAKLIAAKLNLKDVEKWVDMELNGYPPEVEPPPYRAFSTETVVVHNPYRGWMYAGDFRLDIRARQPIAEIEQLSKSATLSIPLEKKGGRDKSRFSVFSLFLTRRL